MNGILQDLRYAVRSLRRRPGFTAAAIATLALGLGANVAVYSVVDALLLRRLPVREPSSLALLTWSSRQWPSLIDDLEGSTRKNEATGLTWTTSFPYPAFELLASQTRSFSRMFAVTANDMETNVQVSGRGSSATTKFVSGSFFDILGVRPAAGRALLPGDDRPESASVAVVSDRFWRSTLSGDPSAVGRTINVNGKTVLLVGVLPPEFFGLEPGVSPDLWLPLHSVPSFFSEWPAENGKPFESRRIWWVEIGGNLRPGVDGRRAREESRVIFDRFLATPIRRDDPGRPLLDVRSIARGEDWTRHRLATPLLILLGLSAVVLVLACVNVAGLLLAKASARTREIAIRRSLGASTARLLRQLLTESVVLAVSASLAALAVAQVLTSGVLGVMARSKDPVLMNSPMNGRVLAFGLAAAAVTGILAGIVPAWRVSHTELTPSLKEAAAPSLGRRHRSGPANLLVSSQVALGLVLVTAAGLFVRTLGNLRSVPLGFRPDHVVLFSVRPGLNGYRGERLAGFYDELRLSLETIPGVSSATLSLHGAVGGGQSTTKIARAGSAGDEKDASVHVVGPRYFETLRIPVVAGRPLDERDRFLDAPSAVINQELARMFFPGENPVGQAINGKGRPPITIVGVVGDVRYNSLRDLAPPTFYVTYREKPTAPDEMLYSVRSTGDPSRVVASIRERVAALDPNLPVVNLQTQEDAIDRALSVERLSAILTGSFGALALALAAMGLYAALAFAVARRTREIGVRIALGAQARQIHRMVVREAFRPTLSGIAAGTVASAASARLLRSQLFGLAPSDPGTLVLAAAVLVATALLACYLPARRAARVDPMVALRND